MSKRKKIVRYTEAQEQRDARRGKIKEVLLYVLIAIAFVAILSYSYITKSL